MSWMPDDGELDDQGRTSTTPAERYLPSPPVVRATPRRGFLEIPESPKLRKEYPIVTGVLDYFPDAIAAVSHVSYVGNQQHNPGQPLHWARGKSMDQEDTLGRHLIQRKGRDADHVRHLAKMAWRALAALQIAIELEHGLDPYKEDSE